MDTPTFNFASELVGGLRDPVDLITTLLGYGIPAGDAVGVVRSYYSALDAGGASGSSPSGSDVASTRSSVSSRASVRRSERTLRWRQEMSVMPDQPGYCYLNVIRWGKRRAYYRDLGMNPTVAAFVARLEMGDLDLQAARVFGFFSIPSQGVLPVVYHIARDFSGQCLGSVYDALASISHLNASLSIDSPERRVTGLDVRCSVGTSLVESCVCEVALPDTSVAVLPVRYTEAGSGSAQQPIDRFSTPSSWSKVVFCAPVVSAPGAPQVRVYAAGVRFAFAGKAVFLSPPNVEFTVWYSGRYVSPSVTVMSYGDIQHWSGHFGTVSLAADCVRYKPVRGLATTTPVDFGDYTLPVDSVLNVAVEGPRVFVTVLDGVVETVSGGIVVAAGQSVECYSSDGSFPLVTRNGARVHVSNATYTRRLYVRAPDLQSLSLSDFTQCVCEIHKTPLTKDRYLAPNGCSTVCPGRAGPIISAFNGVRHYCVVCEEVRKADYRFLTKVLSSFDPGVIDGRIKPVSLAKISTSSPHTTFEAFGNGYCYLHLLSHDLWWRSARVLGPNPLLTSLARVMIWAGKPVCKRHVLSLVAPGLYHVVQAPAAFGKCNSAGVSVYKQIVELASLDPSARIGGNTTVNVDTILNRWDNFVTPAFAVLVACASMLVTILALLVRLIFMRHWYV